MACLAAYQQETNQDDENFIVSQPWINLWLGYHGVQSELETLEYPLTW